MQEFCFVLQYLLSKNSIDIVIGDFNYDLLQVSENKLLDIFIDHVHMVQQVSNHLFKSDPRKVSEYFQQLGSMGERCKPPHWGFGVRCYPNAKK